MAHHVHYHTHFHPHVNDPRVEAVLARLDALEAKDIQMADLMDTELEALNAAAEANKNAVEAAVEVMQGLAQKVAASADDPMAVRAVAEMIRANSLKLASSIQANTDGGSVGVITAPAEPAPAEPVAETPAEPVAETPAEPAPAEPAPAEPTAPEGEQPAPAVPPSEIQG